MAWSITVGTIAGTAVRIHLTFLLFLLWIGIAQALSGGASAAIGAVAFMASLFACVVLHEFGHILAARRYGIRTPEVTLYPIGGVASLEKLPEKPAQELVVALAGPAVNLVIAAGPVHRSWSHARSAGSHAARPAGREPVRASRRPTFFAIFNMVPAFPMDGGGAVAPSLPCGSAQPARRTSRRASARPWRSCWASSGFSATPS